MDYDDKVDNSDIVRNNYKQRGFLNAEIGEKLWCAIEALGVVDGEKKNYVLNKTVGVNENFSCS